MPSSSRSIRIVMTNSLWWKETWGPRSSRLRDSVWADTAYMLFSELAIVYAPGASRYGWYGAACVRGHLNYPTLLSRCSSGLKELGGNW